MNNPRKRSVVRGIGGWLIVPIILFAIDFLIYAHDVIFYFNYIIAYDYGFVYLISEIGLVALSACTLFLLFKKKRRAPLLSIITLWAVAIYAFVISITLNVSTFGSVWGALIWTLYFRKSSRVRNTFTK